MKLKALIVEDENSLLELLKFNFIKDGFKVDTATDGEIALEKILYKPPDLLILDWMLPKLSGIELCRRIRKNKEIKNLPIIMLTARGEEEDRLRGLETGADDYITKPFSVNELMARVKAVLRRKKRHQVWPLPNPPNRTRRSPSKSRMTMYRASGAI